VIVARHGGGGLGEMMDARVIPHNGRPPGGFKVDLLLPELMGRPIVQDCDITFAMYD
jgi:hypothetical protein